MNAFKALPIKRNEELLYNILQYGLLDKMDKVFRRGVYKNEKSI
jgi:5-methylcytosine-specific restriction endonuclease McrBC regulatory subunit McrC